MARGELSEVVGNEIRKSHIVLVLFNLAHCLTTVDPQITAIGIAYSYGRGGCDEGLVPHREVHHKQ